jgi:hypothetical protein
VILPVLIFCSLLFVDVYITAFGSSPSFPQQGIYDYDDDWTLESKSGSSSNTSSCDVINSTSFFPDIASVEYHSDGFMLNSRLWFTSPFKDPNEVENILSSYGILPLQRVYSLYVDIDSSYDIGHIYQMRIVWDSKDKTWTKMLWELPPPTGSIIKHKVSNVVNNYTGFYEKGQNYLDLTLNLSQITFPEQYTSLVYASGLFRTPDSVFCTVRDVTNAIHIPPPEFTISTTPSSISLRPGDEKLMEVQIRNNNTSTNSEILLKVNKNISGIKIDINPNKTSVPPKGTGTYLLSIKAEDDLKSRPYTLSLNSEISLETTLSDILRDTTINDTLPAIITKTYDFTLNVMEPLSFNEHMIHILNNWIDPLTGTYATIVTIVTGILGWKIWRKQKK